MSAPPRRASWASGASRTLTSNRMPTSVARDAPFVGGRSREGDGVVCSSFSPVYRVDSVTTPAIPLRAKTLLVTGASSGIGRAIALAAAAAGGDVAVTWRGNRQGAAETAAGIEAAGRRAYLLQLDLGVVRRTAPICGDTEQRRAAARRVDQQRRGRHPHRRRRGAVARGEAGDGAGRRPAGHRARLVGGARLFRARRAEGRHHQYVLGPCRRGHGGREPR